MGLNIAALNVHNRWLRMPGVDINQERSIQIVLNGVFVNLHVEEAVHVNKLDGELFVKELVNSGLVLANNTRSSRVLTFVKSKFQVALIIAPVVTLQEVILVSEAIVV